MSIKVFAIGLSVMVLVFVLEAARREKLTFKYAIGWIMIAVVAIFFEIFDHLLFKMSQWFGFILPSNFVFFILLVFFVFLSLFLTIFLCRQDKRNTVIAQKIGLMELELRRLKEKNGDDGSPDDPE